MPFATEKTFREYLKSILEENSQGHGRLSEYRKLDGVLEGIGVKIRRSDASNIEALLSSVSKVALCSDPLKGLQVGQQIAMSVGEAEISFHIHTDNAINLATASKNELTDSSLSPDVAEATKALKNLRRITSLSDESLKNWLHTVVELDKKGFAIDTVGTNIMYIHDDNQKKLGWIDVDDSTFSGTEAGKAEHHNHLDGIMKALRGSLLDKKTKIDRGFDKFILEEAPLMSFFEKTPAVKMSEVPNDPDFELIKATIQDEYQKLHQRLSAISHAIGLPLDRDDYLMKNAVQGLKQKEESLVLEEFSMDLPLKQVAAIINKHHKGVLKSPITR